MSSSLQRSREMAARAIAPRLGTLEVPARWIVDRPVVRDGSSVRGRRPQIKLLSDPVHVPDDPSPTEGQLVRFARYGGDFDVL